MAAQHAAVADGMLDVNSVECRVHSQQIRGRVSNLHVLSEEASLADAVQTVRLDQWPLLNLHTKRAL